MGGIGVIVVILVMGRMGVDDFVSSGGGGGGSGVD